MISNSQASATLKSAAGAAAQVEREQRLAAAADWVLRLRDPAISPAQIAAWLSWCDADPLNKQEFTRMQALWQDSRAVREQPVDAAALAADEYTGEVSVEEWLAGRQGKNRRWATRLTHGLSAMPSRRRWLAAAATVLLMVSAAVLLWTSASHAPLGGDVRIATTTGVNRTVILPDSSTVTVAGDSSIATHYVTNERRVVLERGEAYFQVESDRQRPFVVHAMDAVVTAVGTAFNVRAEQGVVRVTVTEGVVDIDRSRPASALTADHDGTGQGARQTEKIRVVAGHQVTLKRNQPDPIVVSANIEHVTAWVSGTLKFVDEPLASVVTAVNRYAVTPVRLADPALAELHYTGTVVAGRADEWLRGLPNVFPVSVRETHDGAVVIEALDGGPR